MKASYFTEHGGPEKLQFGDLPDPVAGPGQIVVDIHASTVNGADAKVLEGSYRQLENFPYVLGRDFSGVVSEVGDGVTDFAVGDEVFAVCEVGQEGTYCEKIVMDPALVAMKPPTLSHADAAALALIGLTATISVEDTLELKSGETILIQGGAGGVAGFAIELAKHLGATVISTCSTKNVDYVKGLGADQVIDYTAEDFSEIVSDVDCVFETVGGDVAIKSFDVLKPGGRAAFIASGAKAPEPSRSDVTALRPAVGRGRKHMERIADLHAQGAVSVPEITTFKLEDAAEALGISAARHLRGKLVFAVRY